jgi:hypothetical protein
VRVQPEHLNACLFATLAIGLGACAPLSPDESDSGDRLPGSTTDRFNITVWHLMDGVPTEPISGAIVHVEFIDDDHIDSQTGRHVIRRIAQGYTNGLGKWSKSATYDGAGELAADKVVFKVTHEAYWDYGNTLPLTNHRVDAVAEMAPRVQP